MKGFKSRFASVYLFGAVFLAASLLLRIALLIRTLPDVDTALSSLLKMFLIGTLSDLVACACCILPIVLLLLFLPDSWARSRAFRIIGIAFYSLAVLFIVYDVSVEWFFWEEFGTRYNLLAIDYMNNPQEVLGNIWQSYPVLPVSAGIVAVTLLIVLLTVRVLVRSYQVPTTFGARLKRSSLLLIVPLAAPLFVATSLADISPNHYTNALARNGVLSLAEAIYEASIDYPQVYQTAADAQVFSRLRELLATPASQFTGDDPHDVTRTITASGPEIRRNVLMIVVESLSAFLVGAYGSNDGLTPNLDALAGESLMFTNMYSTGTRTIRGLEAINLSLPPTPGRAAVRRANADRFFSAERVFRQKGYQTKFIYGGFTRFDSMSAFLTKRAFESIDQSSLSPSEITFRTSWGVCDEDLYRRVLAECDKSAAADSPFFSMVMTVSNHQPFTYPQVIDIPSGSGVYGAVKYSDYAIGRFLEAVRKRPWFANTVLVVMADHCSRQLGSNEFAAKRYHIPAIIHAPGLLAPGRNDSLCSQIDIMPTILGLLNMSYTSKFYGRDILNAPANRAFLGTPDKLALLADGKLLVLLPGRRSATFAVAADRSQTPIERDDKLLFDAITYYQSVGYLLANKLYFGD